MCRMTTAFNPPKMGGKAVSQVGLDAVVTRQ